MHPITRNFVNGLMLALLASSCPATAADEFRVLTSDESPSPADGAVDVSQNAVVRVLFSGALDPRTLDASSMRLMDEDDHPVPAILQTDLTGGVATLSPTLALKPGKTYRLELDSSLRSQAGTALDPFVSVFSTGREESRRDARFVCRRVKVDDRDHNTCLIVGPDGHLYVADAFGEIRRYVINEKTGLPLKHDVPYRADTDQIIGMTWDPEATSDNLLLWISYGQYGQNFGGCIARVKLPPVDSSAKPKKVDVIVGLPHDVLLHHQPNDIAFGPDGRLYQSVGGVATLGGNPNWGMEETLLSAAVIVADVRSPAFGDGRWPVNVQTAPPVRYDPRRDDAPVRIFATGFRNAVGLCWHSSGHLFAATNQNSIKTGVWTPASPNGEIPAIGATPREMLYRVVEGRYYGHPNPSREEYVLNGGNPTRGRDPFEVREYPEGIRALTNFDPALIYDLRPGGGNSANGMCEYVGNSPLHGRLLIAYFGGGASVQSFAIDANGRITSEHPLIDAAGNPHRFQGAIDVTVSQRTGYIYVADFGRWERPNFGHDGAVWLLVPSMTSIGVDAPATAR